MMKISFKKICLLFILLFLFASFIFCVPCNAAVSSFAGKINNDTVFSSDYSFTPKFIKNVTTTQSYGMTNYSQDFLRTDSDNLSPDNFYTARLTSDSQKGKIWVRYNNVGTYNGQIIDLKITLSNWNYLQPENTSANSSIDGVNYPTVAFKKTSIDVSTTSFPAVDSPLWIFTFYKNGTEQIISLKSHLTFKDIDGSTTGNNEKILFNSGFDSAYTTQNSYLTISKNEGINKTSVAVEANDQNAWISCLTSGNNLSFVYTRDSDIKGNSYRDITKIVNANIRTFYHFVIGSESIAPFDFCVPAKACNVSTLRGLEEATYTILHYVPGEYGNFYYTSYILKDQISDCFDIKKIEIIDDSETNRTSWFSISKDNNLVTISAKDSTLTNSNFYNNNFYFNITVAKKADNYISNLYGTENSFIVPNNANIEISAPALNSSRAKTIPTNTVNVTIIKEFELPLAGTSKSFPFTLLGLVFISIFISFKLYKKLEVNT